MEPSLRYLYEYGAMRGDTERDGYPQKFVFQYVAKDNQNVGTPILAKEADCDVYLLPDPRYPNEQRGFMLMEGKQFFYIKNQQ